jgi:hypothetical protein
MGGSGHTERLANSPATAFRIGARFVGALERQSRSVTIAGHGRRARSADLDGISVARLAVLIATEESLCLHVKVSGRLARGLTVITKHPAGRRP